MSKEGVESFRLIGKPRNGGYSKVIIVGKPPTTSLYLLSLRRGGVHGDVDAVVIGQPGGIRLEYVVDSVGAEMVNFQFKLSFPSDLHN